MKNRKQAIKRLTEYGLTASQAEELVARAESENCEPTGRLRNEPHTNEEYKATATLLGRNGVDVFYYPEIEEIERVSDETGNDLSGVSWVIHHYETW